MRGASDEDSGPLSAIATPTSAFDGRLFADLSDGRKAIADLGISVAVLTTFDLSATTGGASAAQIDQYLFDLSVTADLGKAKFVDAATVVDDSGGAYLTLTRDPLGASSKATRLDLFSQLAWAAPATMPVNWSAVAGILCRARLP